MLRATSLAVLCAATTLACGAEPSGHDPLGRSEAPIINGEKSTAEDDSAVAVANLPEGGGFSGACSGVLLSPNIVLTARHCVSRTQDGGIACTKEGKPIVGGNVVSDYPAANLAILTGASLQFEKLRTAPRGKKVIHSGVRNLCNNDIALIILDKPVTDAPYAQIRLEAPPVKGDKILAVGWGVSNNSSGYGRRRRADIPIVNVGPASSSTGGGVGPNEFQIGEGICSGDSGGPAYDMTTRAVLGVVSRGGNGYPATESDPQYISCVDQEGYVTRNLYTRVDTFKDLILQAFAETGEEPWLEGQPDPRLKKFGEVCGGPNECRSNLCIAAGADPYCSQTCADDNPCPEGYACVDVGGTRVCAPPPATAASDTTSKGGCTVTPAASSSGAYAFVFGGVALALAALSRRRRG